MKKYITLCLLTLGVFSLKAFNCGTGQLTLTVTLDNNPTDVFWEIKNTSNVIIAWSGVRYPATSANQTVTEPIATLPDGDYSIVFYDSGGNGLCCSNGNGSFSLTDGGNNVLAQGSIYEYSSLQAFCYNSTNNFVFDMSAPTASTLTASNVTATTVDLSWTSSTDNVGVLGYGIFFDDVNIGYVNTTSGTIPIPNGVTEIYVVSRDEIGNFSPRSNTVTVMPTNGVTTTVFSQSFFETGWDDWNDGGNDCRRYNGNNYSAEGSFSIRLRDNSGSRSSMTSDAFDFSAYDSVRIQFAYYHRNFQTGEDFFIKLRENGTYNTVASFSRPNDFNANGYYSVNVLMDANDFDFASNSRLRIQCDASANNDQIFIDQVILTGYTSASSSNMRLDEQRSSSVFVVKEVAETQLASEREASEDLELSQVSIYPNPADDRLRIENIDLEKIKNFQIFDTNGRLVASHNIRTQEISLLQLTSGLYIAKINMKNGDSSVHKFWKK